MRLFSSIIFIMFILLSCRKQATPINRFSDPVLIRIADLQDRRMVDSLLYFLNSESSEYRYAAALALGSVQDTSAVETLGQVFLSDADSKVRMAAAFALGQTGGIQTYNYLNKAKNFSDEIIGEALAKVISNDNSIPSDLAPWGIYRIGLRGLSDSSLFNRAIKILESGKNDDDRLAAAHFFMRGASEIQPAGSVLLNAARNDASVFVRMAAAAALRRIQSAEVRRELQKLFESEPDFRVRINILRALQPYPFSEISGTIIKALSDENINVAIEASEGIQSTVNAQNYTELVSLARSASNWRVQANLYKAALATTGHKELSEEIIKACEQSSNSYQQAALIDALSNAPMQYGFVSNQLLNSSIPVIRTSSASTLVAMSKHTKFEPGMKTAFLDIYKKALKLEDPAVSGIIAVTLADPSLNYKALVNDISFLYEARSKLKLPKDNEALQPLEKAIAYFENKPEAPEVVNEFNHPIDWKFIGTIPREQQVVVKTDKGDIYLQMLVDEAPGSVTNFLKLASEGYFNGKNFHRVVPNFVIQGGCNRGDGWGSEDYSIRSEFSLRKYKEGSVGMASAGKDTEGTQWFITHSPTPHLDGRYSIFAEVVEGMDVVHRIEIGDKIISVDILNPPVTK
jgi:cyclophilin family peptidyl-prolyl cis-trans isomerase/HEAT repeat protein